MVTQKIYRKYKSYPPGPMDFPFLGCLPQVILGLFTGGIDKEDVMAFVHNLADKHGDLMMVHIAGWKMVYLNNSELTKQFLQSKQYRKISGNKWLGNGFILFGAKDGTQSFFAVNGTQWIKRRKLFISIFTKILTTKFMNKVCGTAVKKVLLPEIDQICIEQKKTLKPREILKYTAFQTIFYANFDRFVDKNDELFIKLRDELVLQNKMSNDQEVIQYAQRGGKISQKYYDARDRMSDIINEIMDQRRAELREKGIDYKNPNASSPGSDAKYTNPVESKEEDLYESIKDLEFESYLDYLLKLVDEGKITNEMAEVDTLLLFGAGYLNVAMSLEWVLNLLAKHNDVQDKIRDELFIAHGIKDNYNGDGINEFNLGLITKCPQFRALIHETLRVSAFARIASGRIWDEDVEMEWKGKKYVIPKDHMIVPNLEYMVIKSKKEGWKSLGFDIDNFLEDGKFKIPSSFASFGYGTRDCPGKAFAVKEMEFISGYLIMNYLIEFGDEEQRKDPLKVEIKTDKKKFTSEIAPEIPLRFSPLK